MKRKRFLRLLGIGVILSLLLTVFLPASPVFAARSITLDPNEGRIGDEVTVEGTGFPEPVDVDQNPINFYIDIYFATKDGTAVTTTDDIDDEVTTYKSVKTSFSIGTDGEFSTTFDVPPKVDNTDVRGGTYYVCITEEDDPNILAVKAFTVIAGEITDFDPDSGPVGTEVDVAGENFAESEGLTIKYDNTDITDDIASGKAKTTSAGDIEFSFIVPPSTAGEHTVTVSDESLSEAEATFTVEPEISVTPGQAAPGKTAEVSGTGFGNKKDVDILLNDASVATKKTDASGNFTVSFTVPDITEGTYDLDAVDADDNNATVEFIVEVGTAVTISEVTSAASPGHVGQSITISGVAFKPNSEVTITYASDPQKVATTTSDANGDFSATFKVPKSPAGAHTISASDGTSTLSVPFYMEFEAPPTPQPLLPEMGTKAPSLTEFDWGDVDDDSDVTYTLQVATSEDFAPASLVLDKEGLTGSDYTLTDEEKLASRSANEPYYWRVKAIDGAGNESDWTGAVDFSVGLSLPPWTVHLWWGLGVIGAIFFGYYLGKRRGYY